MLPLFPAYEDDAAYFESMRQGAKPTKPRTGARGLTTAQLMKFFTTTWTAFDDTPTVRPFSFLPPLSALT